MNSGVGTGADDQTWLFVPVTLEERAKLQRTARVHGRRFLVRNFPGDAPLSAWWREDGRAIGPHD